MLAIPLWKMLVLQPRENRDVAIHGFQLQLIPGRKARRLANIVFVRGKEGIYTIV